MDPSPRCTRLEYDVDDVQTPVYREWLHPKCFHLRGGLSFDYRRPWPKGVAYWYLPTMHLSV
jgi:hypothetical protein